MCIHHYNYDSHKNLAKGEIKHDTVNSRSSSGSHTCGGELDVGSCSCRDVSSVEYTIIITVS